MHEVQIAPHRAARYERPADLAEAIDLLAEHGASARVLAGGSDLLLELQRRIRADVSVLVDITGIPGLNTIEDDSGTISLGPLVTHTQAVASEVIRGGALPLAQACWEVGSPQLRNHSTIAGNLVTASPANDTISPLWALDATLELTSLRGSRRVPLRRFYTGVRSTVLEPDELVTRISFPAMGTDTTGVFVKLGLRRAQAISVVHAAIILELAGSKVTRADLAIGSVAPTIVSAAAAERALLSQSLTDEVIRAAAAAAAAEVTPIDDLRATAEYRRDTVAVVVERGLRALAQSRSGEEWPQSPVLLGPAGGLLSGTGGAPAVEAGGVITMDVNGAPVTGPTAPDETLLDWLRDRGLTGTKEGCGEGECGACTVWLDDAAVMSCLVAAPAGSGRRVSTIEGLARSGEELHPVQREFVEHGAVQCGFCIPGILMAAARLLDEVPQPTREEVGRALSGNLCRCTGYYKIIDAVVAAAGDDE